MTEKAVREAARIDAEITEANGGKPVGQRWVQVRKQMSADKSTRKLVKHLPKRLGAAVDRHRKQRLIAGQEDQKKVGV